VPLSFSGTDASASFATGDFSESGLMKNVLTLSDTEVKAIWDWIAFYEREYIYKGKTINIFPFIVMFDWEAFYNQRKNNKLGRLMSSLAACE